MDALNRTRARTFLVREFKRLARVEGVTPAGELPWSKAEIDAVVAAVDDWATANAAGYNSALPQPFRGQATAELKAFILAVVCLRRAGLASVDGED